MVGVVKVAMRNREQLAALRVRDGVIVLSTMIWPDEVREPSFGFLDEKVQLRAPEKAMAESLIASMAGDFDPADYTDDYRVALQDVIDAKIEGHEVQAAPEQPTAANVVDLMSALKASVDAAKAARGEAPAVKPVKQAKKAPAKKAVAKKAPAKKAATRRSA